MEKNERIPTNVYALTLGELLGINMQLRINGFAIFFFIISLTIFLVELWGFV